MRQIPAVQQFQRRLAIAANVNNIDLYALFGSPRRSGRYVVTILPGVTVGSTTTATAAIRTGSWPRNCRLTLENFGNVYGKEGAGGTPGGTGPGAPGAAGGAAGHAISLGCDIRIDNRGNIFAGGGGGDAGAGGDDGGGGGGTCFPRGSMVLMADKTWREISTVQAGDLVWSPFGPERIAELEITTLGERKLYAMMDGSIMWSSEHTFWVRREGLQWLWSMDRAALKREEEAGIIGGLKDWTKLIDGEEGRPDLFATSNGWTLNTPKRVLSLEHPAFPLYLPRTENGGLIIVDDYLVGACINEPVCDYSRVEWQGVVNS